MKCWMSFPQRDRILVVEMTSRLLSEKVVGESVDSEERLFLFRMHEGTHIKSHIAEFSSIINDLYKIEVKIEDEDQTLLLLCSLPSSYKSFRKAIIYGGKSTIKVNKVKEYLLNKDKIFKREV